MRTWTQDIKKTDLYHSTLTVREYQPDTFSVEIHQLFPQALRPHWVRILQINLNGDELLALGNTLSHAALE